MGFSTLQGSATLIVAFITLFIVGIVLVVVLGMYRRNTVEIEEAEYDLALKEAMKRQVGITEKSEAEVVATLVHLSRNRIGGTIIIEGKTKLDDIEDTGDSFGFGKIKREFMNTILESSDMGKGALLIRRDHIVAYNCKMPIIKNDTLIKQGAGNRHLGAFGTMMKYPDSIILTVSGATGKMSIFGYSGKTASIDFGLQLRETDVLNGVTETELEYRLHSLLENTGLIEDLNSPEVQRDIMIKNENPKQKRERLNRERDQKQAERKAEQDAKNMENSKRQMLRDVENRERNDKRRRDSAIRKEKQKRDREQKQRLREEERKRKLRGDDL